MGVVVSGSGVAPNKVILDICESWSGFHHPNSAGGNPQGQLSDWRSQFDQQQTTGNVLFSAISGAIGGLGFDVNIGRVTHTWTSLAAATTLSGSNANGNYGVPLFQRFSLSQSPPVAFLPHPFRSYRVDYLAYGIVGPNAAADCACGIAGNTAGSMVTGAGTDPYVAWVSRNALNGGRWTPRFRLLFAGAVVDGPDSGVPFIPVPTRLNLLSIVYEEGLIPRIRWLIDNREVHQIAGDANMPAMTIYNLAKAMGANAGGTSVKYAETRFRVEEIG